MWVTASHSGQTWKTKDFAHWIFTFTEKFIYPVAAAINSSSMIWELAISGVQCMLKSEDLPGPWHQIGIVLSFPDIQIPNSWFSTVGPIWLYWKRYSNKFIVNIYSFYQFSLQRILLFILQRQKSLSQGIVTKQCLFAGLSFNLDIVPTIHV